MGLHSPVATMTNVLWKKLLLMVRRYWYRQAVAYTIGLVAIALSTFHILSSLVFTILALAPSSPQWSSALRLGGLLIIAGTAVSLNVLKPLKSIPRRLTGLINGASSMALFCCYVADQLSKQQAIWAVTSIVIGLILGGSLGFWMAGRRGFGWVAVTLVSSLCTYGVAFGLSAWSFKAMTAQRWDIVCSLGFLTGLYLWLTQQALQWTYNQWRCQMENYHSSF